MNKIIIVIISCIYISGCAWVVDFPRTAWGSSIRVLSDKRSDAETQTFSCKKEVCFEIVEALTLPHGVKDENDDKFVLFANDPRGRYLIVMDVPGSVNTTEVGIFFDELEAGQTKVDISSLSSRAKQAVAEIVFTKLSEGYEPDL